MASSVRNDQNDIVFSDPIIYAQRINYLNADGQTRHFAISTDNVDPPKSGQLTCMGSKNFRMLDSELFGIVRKKDQQKVIKIDLRPEAMVKTPQVPK